MREITLGGVVFKITGLTRKAFKKNKLEDYGFDFFEGFTQPEDKKFSECYMKLITASTDKENHKFFDDLTPKDTMALFKQCTAETYGSTDEEKNLQGSGETTDPKNG